MQNFFIALGILLGGAALTGLLALLPATPLRARIARRLGALCAVAAAGFGLSSAVAHLDGSSSLAALPWGMPFGSGAVGLDALSALFLLPVFGLGATCACAGRVALRHVRVHAHNQPGHWCCFLLLMLGMALVMTARDAVLFLVAWEIMSISPFFLIDFDDQIEKVRNAAWVYLTAAHLGVVPLTAFWAILWQIGGSTEFAVLAGAGAQVGMPMLNTLFLFSFLGFGAKAGLMPMHVWLPEAHPAAPGHVSALLSGAMINAGLYGLIRSFDFFGPLHETPAWWGWLFLIVGVASGCLAILKALAQTNLKRMLACSSVENMGVMLIGFGAGLIGARCGHPAVAAIGFAAMLLHMVNHASFKGLLFLCAGEVLHATGTVEMGRLGGLQKRMPVVGAAFAAGAAAICCLPPFNGFLGEFTLVLALLEGGSLPAESSLALLFALVAVTLISGVALAAFVKGYATTFLGEPRSALAREFHAPALRETWPLLVPMLACVAGGAAGPHLLDMVVPAAKSLAGLLASAPVQGTATPAEAAEQARGSLEAATLVGWGMALLASVLLILRRILLRGRVHDVPTWGCGYQFGTARIQYTDLSFTEPFGWIFSPAMGLRLRAKFDMRAIFPGPSSLDATPADRLRPRLYGPIFAAVEQFCNACKVVQHGKIHLYILYIFATAVLLLVWGLNG